MPSPSSFTVAAIPDCLHLPLPDRSVDLVFTSPPYEDARTYGISFALKGQAWVDWALPRYLECLRVCRGLVAWVVAGRTRAYCWSATPALLMAALHAHGVNLRNPPIYHRSGIPGSGGPDWWRSDYEWIICASPPGRLPWSDNTATGIPPVCSPGGDPTHRRQDGSRVRVSGKLAGAANDMPHARHGGRSGTLNPDGTITRKNGKTYSPPLIANPGNVIRTSGGHLGSPFAHENEAPFPEALVEPFVRCFCPPDGTVLDPMMGSGTTLAVALKWGRNAIGYDGRQSQVDLALKRLAASADSEGEMGGRQEPAAEKVAPAPVASDPVPSPPQLPGQALAD
jgi:hypothetical protein